MPQAITYRWSKWFHGPFKAMMAPTQRIKEILEKKYPGVHFFGAKPHNALPPYYRCANVFVFPSLTDTFGLVLVEAMACGVPVAAYLVEGPIDVVAHGRSDMLNHNLARACSAALALKRSEVRAHALHYSWESATHQFMQHLHPVRGRIGNPAVRSLLWQN